jgi:anti-sigma factor RsiW
MNDHLTSQQISEFVAGAAGVAPALDAHIQACDSCRAEAARLTETLALFRDAARRWSLEQESARPLMNVDLHAPRRTVNLWHWGWKAALAACLIAGLALSREHAAKPAPVHQAVAAISDAELLGRVNRELSETVAPSMQPIALNEVRN